MKINRFRANPLKAAPERVDREKGIIYGVSVNTEGPALGHGVMLEREFVEKVTMLGNKAPKGSRSRFGHPGMSSEALGTFMGRYSDYRNVVNKKGKLKSIADFHLSEAADPAKANHIMTLAEKDPEAFATSIVFKGWEYKRDKKGEKVIRPKEDDYDDYGEYDKALGKYLDLDSPRYASIEALNAVDFVDEPAANPDGLFSDSTYAGIAGKFLMEHPAVKTLLCDNPDILEELAKDERFDSFFEAYPQIREFINDKPEAAKSFLEKYNKLPANQEDEAGEEVTLKTYEEFKEKHPEFYQKAFAEGEKAGVKKEGDRSKSHILLGRENDALDIACQGIEDGSDIDNLYTAKYVQAGINKNALQARQEDEEETITGDPEVEALSEQDAKIAEAQCKLMAKRGITIKGGK